VPQREEYAAVGEPQTGLGKLVNLRFTNA
jgi:hypothetical protein